MTELSPPSVQNLLNDFNCSEMKLSSRALRFSGVGHKDVYNITAPFIDEGEYVIAGRVESRYNEESVVMIFVERGGVWVPRKGEKVFSSLQDPFITFIHGELVLGGVEIWPSFMDRTVLEYRTVFYRGQNIKDLQLFAVGPQRMKDIRLVGLPDNRIGVFTRPKGEWYGGDAQIGFTIIESLDYLTPRVIVEAEPIPNLFRSDEWAGVNELHVLDNGLLGVLGHVAYFSEDQNRHYYAMAFMYDYLQKKAAPIKIIAARNCLAGIIQYKRTDLQDIMFAGGLIRLNDGTSELYAGVNDCEAHVVKIPDPFK